MDVAIPMESLMGEGSGSSTTPANSGAGSSSGSIDFDFDIDDLIDGTINEFTEEILEESLNKLRRRDLSCKPPHHPHNLPSHVLTHSQALPANPASQLAKFPSVSTQ